MKRNIAELIIFVILFIGGLWLCQKCNPPKVEIQIREKIDTLIVVDTIRITEPVEIWREVRDTMWVDVGDIIVVHDTTYLPLPREYVTYADTSYTATISGYRPRLEEIDIYPRTQYITIQTEKTRTVTKPTRFGIGAQAGYGITPKGFQPYVGVGISYNILAF